MGTMIFIIFLLILTGSIGMASMCLIREIVRNPRRRYGVMAARIFLLLALTFVVILLVRHCYVQAPGWGIAGMFFYIFGAVFLLLPNNEHCPRHVWEPEGPSFVRDGLTCRKYRCKNCGAVKEDIDVYE